MPYWLHSDAIRLFITWKHFTRASLLATGKLPLWLPYVWSGSTFVGDIISQLFYPLNIPFLFIRSELFFSYYMLLHVALAGFFIYCYARVIGLPVLPASLSAILYMYGGITAVLYHFQRIDWIVCWLPALFLSLEMLAQKKNLTWAIISGIITAIFFLGAHPQIFFFAFVCAAAYFLFQALAERSEMFKVLGLGCLACVIFVGLAAIGLLPSLEAAAYSSRRGGISLFHAAENPISPSSISSFFLTGFGRGDFTCHEGPIALFLVVAALIGPRSRCKSFFIATAAFSLLLALGRYTPLYAVLFKVLPGMKLFRGPTRILVLFGFAIPMLAAYGLRDLTATVQSPRARDRMKHFALIVLMCAAGFMLLVTLLIRSGQGLLMWLVEQIYATQHFTLLFEAHRAQIIALFHEANAASRIILAMIGISGIILYLLLSLRVKRTGYIAGTIVALTLAEAWCFSLPSLMSIDPSLLYRTNALTEFLKGSEGTFRVLNMGEKCILPQYLAVPYQIELADGYNSMMTMAYLIYTNRIGSLDRLGPMTKLPLSELQVDRIMRTALLGLLNVRYLLTEEKVSDTRFREAREFLNVPVYRQGEGIVDIPRVIVYENRSWLPRAFLVPDTIGCSTDEECLELLDQIDPRTTLVVNGGKTSRGGARGKVAISYRTPNQLVIDVSADGPTNLFLSEMWYPGWEAMDNGRPAHIGRANYLFRYLPLEPGNHRIEMCFKPRTFLRGRAISLITIALIAAYLLGRRKLQMQRNRYPAPAISV